MKLILAAVICVSLSGCATQIKNARTENVKVSGNCGMCETMIEEVGNIKKIASVDWDQTTKMAKIIYDTTKTSQDEILKRISLAGYDNEKYLAPDAAYAELHGCCKYEREFKPGTKVEPSTETVEDHSTHNNDTDNPAEVTSQLKPLFDTYFALKDALVQTNGTIAAAKAKELVDAISAVNMGAMPVEEHNAFMKVMKNLIFDAEHIAETKDPEHQRGHFATLSKNMYTLVKFLDSESPLYYQHCPMYDDGKGANWLSKESSIKNPYYGSKMLSCGKTVETIK